MEIGYKIYSFFFLGIKKKAIYTHLFYIFFIFSMDVIM